MVFSVSILKWDGLICKFILFRLRIMRNFPERLGTRKMGDRHNRGWSMIRSTTPRACNAATSVAMPRFMRDDMRGEGRRTTPPGRGSANSML